MRVRQLHRIALLTMAMGLTTVASAFATAGTAVTPARGASKHTTVTLIAENGAIRPGTPFWLGVHLRMDPHWHTYWKNPGDSGLPTRIKWQLPEGFLAGDIQWPLPSRFLVDPLMSYGYEGEVLLLTEVRPPATLLPGQEARIGARIDWLECREVCLPGKAEVAVSLPVGPGESLPAGPADALFAATRHRLPADGSVLAVRATANASRIRLSSDGAGKPRDAYFFAAHPQVVEHATPQTLAVEGGGFQLTIARAAGAAPKTLEGVLVVDGKGYAVGVPLVAATADVAPAVQTSLGGSVSGLGTALLFSFVGGLILNLMPCVLPVLSLKVMGFVKRSGDSRTAALRHGGAFTLGVLVFFWALAGALLALRAAGQQVGWGFQLQSPGFVVFLSALFLLLSLNLFGVFEVGASLTAAGNLQPRSGGLSSSFWSGALATLVATPCTAPFMGAALGFALAQPAAHTLLVFTSLGLGMAAPYAVFSASPPLMRLLPRPGRWMETFKQLTGFVLLGTVVFLVWLFGRQKGVGGVAGLLAALLLVAMGAWVYGRLGLSAPRRGWRYATLASAGALVIGGIALGLSHAQASTIDGPAITGRPASAWEPYSAARLDRLRAQGTPVFLDFTADWCLTCQVNERVALARPEIQRRLREHDVVLMKADWTRRDPEITKALAAYGRQGVPLYVLHGPGPGGPSRILPEVLSPGLIHQTLDEFFEGGRKGQ